MTTPHTSLSTRQKLLGLRWDVLFYLEYSPDLAPSDFYLFCYVKNTLREIMLNSDDIANQHLVQFFAIKDKYFHTRGIMKLIEQRPKVIEQYISLIYFQFLYKYITLKNIGKNSIIFSSTQNVL